MNRLLILACSALLTVVLGQARADLASDLNDFYDSATYTNITGFGAYRGQTTNMLTAGGITWRVPNRTFQPFSIQLPRLRMGCGGIDLFTGGFSFINSDQLVAMLRNIGSAALSYGLMMAIKIISPESADIMEKLEDWANWINSLNVNSCEAGRKLMEGAFKTVTGREWGCISARLDAGDDYTQAKQACGPGGAAATTKAPPDTEKATPMTEGNLVWKALVEAGFTSDRLLAEAVMSLTGTVIIKPAPDAEQAPDKKLIPPILGGSRGKKLIQALLKGGRTELYQCDTTDADGCLDPTPQTVTIPQTRALRNKVYTQLVVIAISIVQDANPTDWDPRLERLLETSTLPVYRYMTTMVATGGATLAIYQANAYAEFIALDIVRKHLTDLVLYADKAVTSSRDNKSDTVMEQFQENVAKALRALGRLGEETQRQLNIRTRFTQEMMIYQKMLAARVPASTFGALGRFRATAARVQ